MSDPPARGLPAWAPRRLPAWAPAVAIAAALAALVASSFLERWETLTASPFPLGVDGYYYPIQLRALLETGGLQYPSAPVAFWLMAPFAAATDPITGAKLAAALYGALIALPAYGLGARLGRGPGAGLLAAALAAKAAGSAYLTIEFVKNGIGLTVALAALWLILRAADAPSRARIAGALLAALAAALTHKMAAGLVAAVAIPAVLAGLAGRGALRGRRLIYVLLGLAGAGAAAAIWLLIANTALVEGLLTADARWDAPAHAGRKRDLMLGHEALAGLVVGLCAALAWTRRGGRAVGAAARAILPREVVVDGPARLPPGDAAAGWAIAALALGLGLPWLDVTDAQGLGFRLRIAAFVPLALCAAMLAGRLLACFRHRDLALAGLAALLAAYHTPGSRDEGRVPTHPALITSVHALAGKVPPGDTLIVPERHIAYMFAWYLRARVSLGPDQFPPDRRWRVMPLAWIEAGSALDRALLAARDRPGAATSPGAEAPRPLGLHPRHPNGMVVVAEPVWQEIAARLPPGSPWPAWPTR